MQTVLAADTDSRLLDNPVSPLERLSPRCSRADDGSSRLNVPAFTSLVITRRSLYTIAGMWDGERMKEGPINYSSEYNCRGK